jgi:hypothetical protein
MKTVQSSHRFAKVRQDQLSRRTTRALRLPFLFDSTVQFIIHNHGKEEDERQAQEQDVIERGRDED